MKFIFTLPLAILLASCNPQGSSFSFDDDDQVEGDWLIPSNEIFDGGPGKDGIPSIDNPQFITAEGVEFLSDDDLVIAISFNDKVKVYPHPILDWHEIVNDRIDDFTFALTYCPLTGTAINWDRTINGKETTFGVSGLLYNSNLIPYDRATDSNWSQIRLDCVNGENSGTRIETIPVFEGTWAQVKQIENIEILSTVTGFSRDYDRYPYGDYRTNHSNLIFPLSNMDSRLENKERTLGILGGDTPKVYSFNNFMSDSDEIIVDVYNGRNIIIAANKTKNYIVAFHPHEGHTYEPLANSFPYILQDEEGREYDVFGKARDESAADLEQPEQFIGYWFSWAAFYPDLELYEN